MAIQQLTRLEEKEIKDSCEFITHLNSKEHQKVAALVGNKCVMTCKIAKRKFKALWDSGAQVSLLSLRWLQKNFPGMELKKLSTLLEQSLQLEGVGGRIIPYTGYVELEVEIGNYKVLVPFLVTDENIIRPIVGYNVMEAIAKMEPVTGNIDDFKNVFEGIPDDKLKSLLCLLKSVRQQKLAKVFTYKQGAVIRAHSSISIPCKVEGYIPERRLQVLFEPAIDYSIDERLQINESLITLKKGSSRIFVNITNDTSHDIKLSGKTWIGDLQMVRSVIPTEVKFKEKSSNEEKGSVKDGLVSAGQETTAGTEYQTENGKNENEMLVLNGEHLERMKDGVNKIEDTNVKEIINPVTVNNVVVDDENVGLCGKLLKGRGNITEEEADFVEKLNELNLNNIDEEQQGKVRMLLWKEREAFALSPDEIGDAKDLEMVLNTVDETPVQRSYVAVPRPLYDEVKAHIQDLLNRGWIKKSKSSWCSPVVIVRKKTGEMRLCVDFRGLNKKTVQDAHPLPRVQETLDNLGGKSYFSIMDQSRAYYQGRMSAESQKKTAFILPWGLYEFVRIPFGLMNAPSCFQRYMESVIEDFRDDFATAYLDDLIVYSDDFHQHLEHIRKVLQRVKSKGLKLKLQKCSFFQEEVKFLGRIVSRDGYRMDPDSIAAVQALKDIVPKNVGQVRQLLGVTGYHRRSIQDFARIAKPLTNLLLEDAKDYQKKNNRKKDSKHKGVPSSKPIEWKQEHQKALDVLIDCITSAPILAYPDFQEKFYLHTDASQIGLGCILYQKQKGVTKVLGYGSRTLKPAEENYHSSKLEFLCLKWSITEHFRDYLAYTDHFEVFTDCNPLTYLMESSKLNATTQRWISELSEFNFTTNYRPGVVHKAPDCLSRLPLDINGYEDLCTERVELDTFQAIMAGVQAQQKNYEAWLMPLALNFKEEERLVARPSKLKLDTLKEAQMKDPAISQVVKLMKKEISKDEVKDFHKEAKLLMRELKRLHIDDKGLLRRHAGTIKQIVLPETLRYIVYEKLHRDMGHIGVERTHQLARQRLFWPKMYSDIEEYVQTKCPCVVQKRPVHQKAAPLQSIHSSSPMELISIDFLHLERSSGGHEYILLVVDHFSRFAQGYPTRNKEASTAAKHIYGDFVLRFGLPGRIMHDQGKEFENRLFAELERLSGVEKSRTTPYHPQSNGAVERMNATLLKMLRTLPENHKSKWHESVNKMLFAYNATRHDSTGYSPYYLLFGREAILPIDFVLNIEEDDKEPKAYNQFVKSWREQMEHAYYEAQSRSRKRKLQDEARINSKPLLTSLEPGDLVLVRNTVERGGPGKLRSYWEPHPYVVKEITGTGKVVNKVERLDGTGKPRVLHRNMLMPCHQELADKLMKENTEEVQEKLNRIRTRKQNLSNLKELNQEEIDLENLDNQEVESRSLEPNQFHEAIDTVNSLRPQAKAFRPGKTWSTRRPDTDDTIRAAFQNSEEEPERETVEKEDTEDVDPNPDKDAIKTDLGWNRN